MGVCSAVLLEQIGFFLFFRKRTTKIMQLPFHFRETKISWCSWCFSRCSQFWRWASFLSFFLSFLLSLLLSLGTAVLFEPLTARLVDFDQ